MLVCVDLARRGYEVFRAISPSCSCDIIALKDGIALRVESRTGYRTADGGWLCSRKGVHDVLACVVDQEIFYDPPLT